jgi:hypothetical protein
LHVRVYTTWLEPYRFELVAKLAQSSSLTSGTFWCCHSWLVGLPLSSSLSQIVFWSTLAVTPESYNNLKWDTVLRSKWHPSQEQALISSFTFQALPWIDLLLVPLRFSFAYLPGSWGSQVLSDFFRPALSYRTFCDSETILSLLGYIWLTINHFKVASRTWKWICDFI